jgi:SAM-dependent methyltransferase
MKKTTTKIASRPSPVAPAPLDDLPAAVALIAEATGESTAEVRRRLRRELQWLGCNVREEMRRRHVAPFVFGEEMGRFYAETDAFVYETFTWNRYLIKQKMRRWILSFLERRHAGPARVLAFGDGLGFDSAGLALAGHRVTCFDVGRRGIAFARKMFAVNRVHVDILTDANELAAESFDAVVCLDVLEHVPSPPELVRQLAGYLRPGGYLFSHAPFWFLHPSVGTHLAANRKYSGELRRLYGAAGLRAVDAALAWNPIALQKVSGPGGAMPPVPLPIRAKLCLGGMLLKSSRWWKCPLITVTLILNAVERRRLTAST